MVLATRRPMDRRRVPRMARDQEQRRVPSACLRRHAYTSDPLTAFANEGEEMPKDQVLAIVIALIALITIIGLLIRRPKASMAMLRRMIRNEGVGAGYYIDDRDGVPAHQMRQIHAALEAEGFVPVELSRNEVDLSREGSVHIRNDITVVLDCRIEGNDTLFVHGFLAGSDDLGIWRVPLSDCGTDSVRELLRRFNEWGNNAPKHPVT
jgi:hypothetical protein